METGRSSLPTLAEAIAGRHLRGSWMADREVYDDVLVAEGRLRRLGAGARAWLAVAP